jgi:hypothetical protein
MKGLIAILLMAAASTFVASGADTLNESPPSLPGLRANGAFTFPQKNAKVLCDRPDLRLSVWNNDKYLVAQAVLWSYDHASLSKTNDNGWVTDWSEFGLDIDANGTDPHRLEKNYVLNAPAGLKGLHYFIRLSEKSITPMKSDSQGRGAMLCMGTAEGKYVRVDTYLIPIEEIRSRIGDKIRICYCGASPKWLLNFNSVGYEPDEKDRNKIDIPHSMYHEYILTSGGEIDATRFPDDQRVITSR